MALALCLVAVASDGHSSPAETGAGAPSDSLTPPPTGASLRGTADELPRDASALQYAGRAVLFVPYVAVELITLPVLGLVYVSEEMGIARDIGRFLSSQLRWRQFRLGLYVQSQSGAGTPAPGLRMTGRDWIGAGSDFDLVGGYLSPTRNQIGLRMSSRPSLVQGMVTALYSNLRDQPFYGLGSDSPDVKYANNQERGLVELSAILGPRSIVPFVLTGYYRSTRLSSPSSGLSVQDQFPQLYSVAQRSEYIGIEGRLSYDTRDRGPLSVSGLFAQLVGGSNVAQTGQSDYRHYSAEIQAFIDIAERNRVLAFRGFAGGIDSDDPTQLPYTEFERTGGRIGMRGYNRYRFADRNQLVLTGAYRYRITSVALGSIFVDWGSVSSSWDKMRLADIRPSIGMGLGFFGSSTVGIQAAVSHEGWQFYFGIQPIVERQSRRLE